MPGQTTTLIDSGVGPNDLHGYGLLVGGNLIRQLQAYGFEPADIDLLALTHLHMDHVGGIVDVNGEIVFPNAQVLMGADDWAYFMERDDAELAPEKPVREGLRLLAERGRVTLLTEDGQIAPGVTRIAAPGHTPGHSVYAVHDGPERALILGDTLYCAEQVTEVDWAVLSDFDPVLARSTRERILREKDASGDTGVGCHFPELRAGRLVGGKWTSR
ncbi:MBL fold metallo-hydrolase [Arthrobacter sp. NyZ413]|uniref:MBL fold metallo-hydrolase n=1 Tax=Arthrobacter sp. NyZ413 TaxID=3144669 RepID=UPI003BF77D0A